MDMPFSLHNPLGNMIWNYWNQRNASGENEMETVPPGGQSIAFGSLEGLSGESISLKWVDISGVIDGLLFSSRITQTYRNDTGKAQEVIYTFPLGWQAALLEMKAHIGGKWLDGEVIAKNAAEKKYEDALEAGDAAILVQESSRGLYTANLGNIGPGEKIEIMLHCCQMLSFEQGRVRLCIPTVIGERYGDPYIPGGLERHEGADVDYSANYPLNLEIIVRGEMAKGRIMSPTHALASASANGEVRLELSGGAMDRDFVLLLDGVSAASHACCIEDKDTWMAVASFAPEIRQDYADPVLLKILVDCSGSMSGMSIKQARKGLAQILKELTPDDYVSYSRFGSGVNHFNNRLERCEATTLRRLGQVIGQTNADMGGTEMESALKSTLKLEAPKMGEAATGILLITDGDVWDVKNIIDTARKSGQRIFAIGVGAAPAQSLLTSLAEETGGASEFVTPNENMAGAIVRMFQRMRGGIAANIRVEWDSEPIWQSRNPACVYNGETAHCFALLNRKPRSAPILKWTAHGMRNEVQAPAIEESCDVDLLRMVGMRQMEETANKKERLALALKYQLVSDVSSLILVHERAENEKLKGLPKIQRVPQMPAYGHGTAGPLMFAAKLPCHSLGLAPSPVLPGNLFGAKSLFGKPLRKIMDVFSRPPVYLPSPVRAEGEPDASLQGQIAQIWKRELYNCQTLAQFIDIVAATEELTPVLSYIDALANELGIEPEQVWTVFIAWILEKEAEMDRHSRRLLSRVAVKEIDRALLLERFDTDF